MDRPYLVNKRVRSKEKRCSHYCRTNVGIRFSGKVQITFPPIEEQFGVFL